MKYCLWNHQTDEYLSKCDEIKINYKDKDNIINLVEKYPNKNIILNLRYFDENIDFNEIRRLNIISKNRLICAISHIEDASMYKDAGIKFYYGFPIKTFYELNALKELGVCYIVLDAPIFFEMSKVKKFGIPVRVIADSANNLEGLHSNGLFGSWIRPEDVSIYEEYVDVIEFSTNKIDKEQALYRIYAEDKKWPGELQMLITDLNYPGVNRMIGSLVGLARLNCGQRCQSGGYCSVCQRAFDLANPQLFDHLLESTEEN